MTGKINWNGVDTLFAEVTGSAATDHVYLIGKFEGDPGHFIGRFVTQTEILNFSTEITVTGDNSVEVGNTLQLHATTDGSNKEVAWRVTVNDEDKATIDQNGLLTTKTAGTATVIVSALDGSLITKNYLITITPDITKPTATVDHDESAKTIAYSFSEPVQLLNADGTPNTDYVNSLAIYDGKSYEAFVKYGTEPTKAIGVKITNAVLADKVLTITYSGSLINKTNTSYVVDAWGKNITDLVGNKMAATTGVFFTVTGDTASPIITLFGNAIQNIQAGDPYVEGASATDNMDHDITIFASGDTIKNSIPGTYTVTYSARDTAGNQAVEVTLTINVSVPINTQSVKDQITKLPNPVTLNNESEVGAARTAYNALTTIQKGLVLNYSTLTTDETQIATLQQLAAYKTTKLGELSTAFGAYHSTDYTTENWTTLSGFDTAGIAAINEAGDLEGVDTALSTATAGMSGVEFLTPVEQYATTSTTTLESNTTSVVLDTGSSSVEKIIVPVTIPSTQEITLDMSTLLVDSSDSVTLGTNSMTLERQGTNNYSALLPAGTVITGDSNWDGNLILPTITILTSSVGTVNVAVEMGSTERLNFSKAIKVVLGGMAGKNALYQEADGTQHTISACKNANDTSAGSLTSGGECYVNSSNNKDLIIWTYHFTTFAAYTKNRSSSGSRATPATPAVPTISPAVPATPAIGKVLGAEKFNFTLLMKNGSKSNDVIELQKLLTTLGYTLTADGKFGPKTKGAVIKFQIANGLKGDGIIGPLTRAFLNK